MKQHIRTGFSSLLTHRRLLGVLIALVLVGLSAVMYIVVRVEPSELRVVTHYSAFGDQHFYRDQWFYLLNFAGATVVAMVLGVAIALKLLLQEREDLAILIAWLSIVTIILIGVVFHQLVAFI